MNAKPVFLGLNTSSTSSKADYFAKPIASGRLNATPNRFPYSNCVHPLYMLRAVRGEIPRQMADLYRSIAELPEAVSRSPVESSYTRGELQDIQEQFRNGAASLESLLSDLMPKAGEPLDLTKRNPSLARHLLVTGRYAEIIARRLSANTLGVGFESKDILPYDPVMTLRTRLGGHLHDAGKVQTYLDPRGWISKYNIDGDMSYQIHVIDDPWIRSVNPKLLDKFQKYHVNWGAHEIIERYPGLGPFKWFITLHHEKPGSKLLEMHPDITRELRDQVLAVHLADSLDAGTERGRPFRQVEKGIPDILTEMLYDTSNRYHLRDMAYIKRLKGLNPDELYDSIPGAFKQYTHKSSSNLSQGVRAQRSSRASAVSDFIGNLNDSRKVVPIFKAQG